MCQLPSTMNIVILTTLLLITIEVHEAVFLSDIKLRNRREMNTILRHKWEQVYCNLDIDNVGNVYHKDLDIIKARLLAHPNMTEKKKDEATEMMTNIWKANLGAHLNDTLTMDDFLARNQQIFDSGTMATGVNDLRGKMFDIIDLNDDGKLSFDEFKIFSQATGKGDEATLHSAFDVIDSDNNGEITKIEYLAAYVAYMTDEKITIAQLPLFGKGP